MFYIYTITNITTGNVYVGMTTPQGLTPKTELYGEHPKRFNEHLSSLTRRDHYNAELQTAWDDGWYDDFIFEVVDSIDSNKTDGLALETEWINAFPSVYNIRGTSKRRLVPRIAEADIKEVKTRLAAGHTGKRIARELGVSTASVSLIKNGLRVNRSINRV